MRSNRDDAVLKVRCGIGQRRFRDPRCERDFLVAFTAEHRLGGWQVVKACSTVRTEIHDDSLFPETYI